MKKLIVLLAVLGLTMTFAPMALAHEENEAEEARSEHFLGVSWDAPWIPRALVFGGLAVVGIYAMQRR